MGFLGFPEHCMLRFRGSKMPAFNIAQRTVVTYLCSRENGKAEPFLTRPSLICFLYQMGMVAKLVDAPYWYYGEEYISSCGFKSRPYPTQHYNCQARCTPVNHI